MNREAKKFQLDTVSPSVLDFPRAVFRLLYYDLSS